MRLAGPDGDRGVYGISVAAELVGMGVQNLRLYEARGLVEPERTDGGTRRYSADDLNRLRHIGNSSMPGSTSPASAWSSTSKLRTPNYERTTSNTGG